MFFVCRRCGAWDPGRPVVGSAVVCECGERRPIEVLPLFLVTGASGAGKSTVGDVLLGNTTSHVVLEADILWSAQMNTPEDDYARFGSTWLRMAANIHQAGRSVLLMGARTPDSFAELPERAIVGAMPCLALVASDEELVRRLRARPAWRGVNDSFVAGMLRLNQHLRERADVTIVDTTNQEPAQTAASVVDWLRRTDQVLQVGTN
jgi:broad-specificity NMP kinase